nr:hypothetical protein Iba_chr01eCG0800 [Ipomoea batatas]
MTGQFEKHSLEFLFVLQFHASHQNEASRFLLPVAHLEPLFLEHGLPRNHQHFPSQLLVRSPHYRLQIQQHLQYQRLLLMGLNRTHVRSAFTPCLVSFRLRFIEDSTIRVIRTLAINFSSSTTISPLIGRLGTSNYRITNCNDTPTSATGSRIASSLKPVVSSSLGIKGSSSGANWLCEFSDSAGQSCRVSSLVVVSSLGIASSLVLESSVGIEAAFSVTGSFSELFDSGSFAVPFPGFDTETSVSTPVDANSPPSTPFSHQSVHSPPQHTPFQRHPGLPLQHQFVRSPPQHTPFLRHPGLLEDLQLQFQSSLLGPPLLQDHPQHPNLQSWILNPPSSSNPHQQTHQTPSPQPLYHFHLHPAPNSPLGFLHWQSQSH